ncbi:TRAP transporter substrate-binding protein DctP [Pusillimonas sp. T2]|uniref:TRAP transporter substrate-binding protein DctP n=1 Tax=Pusillimonas sp. T2 TaxID=1548123 RepID=UPI0013033E3A|nr:TRAP transporter substrate-binding protein DctP [Pusillimonas sp. T2]
MVARLNILTKLGRAVGISAFSIACLAAFPASAAAAEVQLKAASFIPFNTAFGRPFKAFIDRVNETGKGVIQISAVGPEAIPGMEQPNALRSGLVDMIANPPSMYKSAVPEAHVQDLSNMTQAEQRASGGQAAMNESLKKKLNAVSLTAYGNGVPFYLYLTQDKVKSIEDFKGLRIRSQPNYAPFLRALGASQTMVAIPETYTALERGVVDGLGYPGWGIEDLGWDKMLKVRVEPGFYSVVVNIMMNNKKLEQLTPEQRKVIDDAVVWFEDYMVQYDKETTLKSFEAQKAAGIKAVNLGPEYLKLARDAMWEDVLKNSPKEAQALQPLFQK